MNIRLYVHVYWMSWNSTGDLNTKDSPSRKNLHHKARAALLDHTVHDLHTTTRIQLYRKSGVIDPSNLPLVNGDKIRLIGDINEHIRAERWSSAGQLSS